VYKAKWHGSYVAAKVLKRSDEIALGDFRTEIAILRKIHHPNCVQFLGACTKQKPYIVITELMACSLADAFLKTFYAPTQRRQVEIALDFARGMAYLHSRRQPIVHRWVGGWGWRCWQWLREGGVGGGLQLVLRTSVRRGGGLVGHGRLLQRHVGLCRQSNRMCLPAQRSAMADLRRPTGPSTTFSSIV
jgi:hypothetical protein